MKNQIVILLMGLFLFAAASINAQVNEVPADIYNELSKQEKKEWKKMARTYKRNPQALKVLTLEREFFVNENNRLANELTAREHDLSAMEMQLTSLKFEMDKMGKNMTDLSGETSEGIVYKLQIGAFEKVILSAEMDDPETVVVEGDDKVQKILLGNFKTYGKAKEFQKYLQDMGVRDAWIVSYKNGKRVPIEEALMFN